MKAVLQRVSAAKVEIEGKTVAEIGKGLLILLGVAQGDGVDEADFLAEKAANLRIFEDGNGKINKSCLETGGEMLIVSNFTLCADARHGRRPSFTGAAAPELANSLYERFIAAAKDTGAPVQTGSFGADMMVSLVNDGPVTILLNTDEIMTQRR